MNTTSDLSAGCRQLTGRDEEIGPQGAGLITQAYDGRRGSPARGRPNNLTKHWRSWPRLPSPDARAAADDRQLERCQPHAGAARPAPGIDPGGGLWNDPIAAIKSLADEVADPDLKKRLQSIEELFAAELSKCNEIEDRAVRAALLNGALELRTLKEDKTLIGAVEAARKNVETHGQTDMVAHYDAQLVNWHQRTDLSTRAYTSHLFQVAHDYPPVRRQAQHDVLVADLEQSGQAGLARYVTRFTDELTHYTLDPSLSTEQLIERATAD